LKVTLISYTPDALTLLLRTKGTRLGADDDPAEWSEEKRMEHLAYMKDTIKSSWEFVSYTFTIEDVTRAFTHQLVRTRHGSYAQEAMRVVDAREHGFLIPPSATMAQQAAFIMAADNLLTEYGELIDTGMAVQDARGLLPTNIFTSITAQFNLRGLHDMAQLRLCFRVQGEYQSVFRAMKREVVAVHPWAEPFIRVACATTGVCIFPRYTECPIQPLTYNAAIAADHHKHVLASIQYAHERTEHEAVPKVFEGKTA
jgi:flavin-dependent thymidylate synthase